MGGKDCPVRYLLAAGIAVSWFKDIRKECHKIVVADYQSDHCFHKSVSFCQNLVKKKK